MNKSSSCKASEKGAESENQKYDDLNSIEDSDPYCSDLWCLQGHNDVSNYEELQFLSHVGPLDDLYFDILSPRFQSCGNDMAIPSSFESEHSPSNEDKSSAFPPASLEILRHYRSKIPVDGKKIYGRTKLQARPSPSPLSTNHIIELSAGNFIQKNSAAINPYASTFLGLSTEHAKDVQLVQDLLSCAEKVYNQQYDTAKKLLEECKNQSFRQTNTIQRLVYYFSEALHDKIEREPGKHTVANLPLEHTIISSAMSVFHQKSPLNQVTQFTCIQSVVDHVSDCRKVHIIDLEIYCGIQQMILMKALAARSDQCPLQHFKITAIAMKATHTTEEAGVRLKNLARSFNLDFSFHVITLEKVLDLQMDLDPEETVVVHATYALKSMIPKPNQLETLMRVIRNINPRAMIVTEAEANVNSPVFVNRFVEALFFYGANFDCVEHCMKNDAEERTIVESELFSHLIRNTVASEGEERTFRAVGINVWREFFARFRMEETGLSELALDHANLVLDMFDCRDSCTLSLNGKCLIVGWKGTPLCSVSAWKFHGTRSI